VSIYFRMKLYLYSQYNENGCPYLSGEVFGLKRKVAGYELQGVRLFLSLLFAALFGKINQIHQYGGNNRNKKYQNPYLSNT